jgi:diguanylate cyclase (GGDEF)-like protein
MTASPKSQRRSVKPDTTAQDSSECHACRAHLRPEYNYCPHCGMPADPSSDRPLFVIEGLTNLFNVVFFESLLETEINRATRYQQDLSIMVAEIDLLPELEAAYGYEETSRMVRQVGEIIHTTIRDPDTLAATNRVAALGTQRFLVLLPHTPLEGAFKVAEKIRTIVASTVFDFSDGPGTISMTIGVASNDLGSTRENLLGRATQALIEGRAKGTNRVQVSSV